jgi:hypothetical protein
MGIKSGCSKVSVLTIRPRKTNTLTLTRVLTPASIFITKRSIAAGQLSIASEEPDVTYKCIRILLLLGLFLTAAHGTYADPLPLVR